MKDNRCQQFTPMKNGMNNKSNGAGLTLILCGLGIAAICGWVMFLNNTNNASVYIPGISQDNAEAIREYLNDRIVLLLKSFMILSASYIIGGVWQLCKYRDR